MVGLPQQRDQRSRGEPKSAAAIQVEGQRKPVQAEKTVPPIASSANKMYRREGR